MCRHCWNDAGLSIAAIGSTSRTLPSTRRNPAGVFMYAAMPTRGGEKGLGKPRERPMPGRPASGSDSVAGNLAADGAHAANGLGEVRAVDEMARFLAQHRRPQQLDDRSVALTRSHRGAEVVLLEREQAGADLTVGGQPDAVEVAAERTRH